MGVVVRHINGGFGGSFLVYVPAGSLESDEEFEFLIDAGDLTLDPTLQPIKDELVESPVGVAVESFWVGTVDDSSGLEIYQVEILPAE